MGRKGIMWVILVVVSLVSVSPVFAESIFGPKPFIKDKGAPVVYTQTFNVSSDIEDPRLLVRNGGDAFGEVKNLSIEVNGAEVVSSKDLRSTNTIEKPLDGLPAGDTTLTVTLKGAGGTAVYVEFQGTKNTYYVPAWY